MADDWQVGDLALCVRARRSPLSTLKVGGIYEVDAIRWARNSSDGSHGVGLMLVGRPRGWKGGSWIDGRNFRKIKPLTDEERKAFEADLRVPGHDLPTHTPQAPAREVVALPARSETHTPLQGRAGFSLNDQRLAHGHADTSQVQ